MKTKTPAVFRIVCLTIGLLATLTGAHAQRYTDTNPIATGAWNTLRWSSATNGPFTSAWAAGQNVFFLANNSYVFDGGMGAPTNVGNITVSNGATVTFTNISSTLQTGGNVRTFEVQSGALLDLNLQAFSTAAGTGFIKTGDGVYATGSGTNQGGFTLNGGTVIIRGTTGLGGGATNVLTLSNGVVAANSSQTLADTRFGGGIRIRGDIQFGAVSNSYAANAAPLIASNANISFANAVSLGATTRTLTIGGNGNYTLSGPISGDSADVGLIITNTSTGKFVLSGTNTYTGTTTIAGGRVDISAPAGANTFASTNIVISGGTLSLTFGGAQNIITNIAKLTISSGGFNGADRNQTFASLDMSGGFMTKSGFGVLAFSGASSVTSGSITNTGINSDVRFLGGLTLGGASIVYNNATNAGNGIVRVSNNITYSSNALGAAFNNNAAGIGRLELLGTGGTNTFDIGDGGVATDMAVNWNVTGSVTLRKTGDGALAMSQSNSFTNLVLEGGRINADHNNALGSGLVTLNSATTNSELRVGGGLSITNALQVSDVASGRTNTLRSFSTNDVGTWAGSIDIQETDANSFRLQASTNASLVVSGAISGVGGFRKIDQGIVTLSGSTTNTYAGNTVINLGTLRLNKTANTTAISGDVSIATGATLLISASEQVADTSAVTLSGGTILRDSGVSEAFGNLTVSSASTLDFGSGTEGTLSFGAYSPTVKLTLNNFFGGNVLTFGSDLTSSIAVGTYNTTSYTSGDGLFEINSISGGFTTSYDGGTFTITAIPEPSTVLAALGLGGLMLWPTVRRLRGKRHQG